MKTNILIVLFSLGVVLTIVAPAYQILSSTRKEIPSGWIEIYGDNDVQNFLGVKTMEYEHDFMGGHLVAISIITAPWMRNLLNLPDKVVWGKRVQFPSSSKQICIVRVARTVIKLIPLILTITVAIIFFVNLPNDHYESVCDPYSDGERDPMFP